MLHAGYDGVVVCSEAWESEVAKAIPSILRGGLWFPAPVLAEYARDIKRGTEDERRLNRYLTARESQILQMVIRRLSNKEIAQVLDISERTVKFHVSNLLNKLAVNSRQEVIGARHIESATSNKLEKEETA
jgi:DNA-binding NarL/FixJ family response regulator